MTHGVTGRSGGGGRPPRRAPPTPPTAIGVAVGMEGRKGGELGSAYKVTMRNGVTVAVKRMRDMNRVEFEEHIQMLGDLRHPNVLSPVGYHYRRGEKLIVSEFMPRGSLLYVLHGDQRPDRVVLDWPARMRIAVGVV
uniref:Receptor-like protein kinase 3-like n=2 Tax=Oryza sativa subsp. japonica TaxID=39947 RepID=Q5Z8W4_ORYSJ|nr:receptor-like protein kinase 3-like [Oryza sativa Japonica Group]